MGNRGSRNFSEPEVKKTKGRERKVSEVRLTCYEETDGGKRFSLDMTDYEKNGKKRCRKHTRVPLTNGEIKVTKMSKEIVTYCVPLLTAHFVGQTTSIINTDVDSSEFGKLNLGTYLRLLDEYLRRFDTVYEFTGTEDYYLKVLSYIAEKRKFPGESAESCYERLLEESKRFVQIYHDRGVFSQELTAHKNYWGTRQQLLSAKVISDWVDRENGPLDPIFGALLQPTTGRAGPGDSGWFHEMIFDGKGHVAYHSAVHDAFGYLLNFHNIGPGYDYMNHSLFGKSNPLAGQLDGMRFWKNVLNTVHMKPHIMELTTNTLDSFNYESKARSNSLIL